MTTPTSTINPLLPATDAPIESAPVRDNFQAAYNDVTNIYNLLAAISYGSIAAQNNNAVTITGGNINSTTIGLTTPAAAKFTNLNVTGTFTPATNSLQYASIQKVSASGLLGSVSGNTDITEIPLGTGLSFSSGSLRVTANGITNALLDTVPTATFKARATVGTGNSEDITATQATALLNNFVGDSGSGGTKGLVLAPASGDGAAGKFLKANGSWAVPFGGGDVVGPGSSTTHAIPRYSDTTGTSIIDSGILIDDTNHITGAASITSITLVGNLTGNVTGNTSGNAGTVTTNANLTGDVTSVGNATTIGANKVTNSMLSNVSTSTFKGRTSGGSGSPEDLTPTQATALLNVFVGDSGSGGVKGLAPSTVAGDSTKFLRGDGTWANPASGGTVTSVSVASANGFTGTVANATTTPAITIIAGAITPTSVNGISISGSSTPTLTVTGTTSVSGTNTGDQTNITGNAGTVTTNANLTGVISSSGNSTTITSQTGTGTKFVVDNSPTLITPVIGAATATTVNKVTITQPANGSTLTINDARTLTVTADATVSGTNTGDQTITLTGDVTGSGTGSFSTTIKTNVSLAGNPTTTTQSAGDNSTKISTTAFVTTAVNNAISGANPAVAVQAATTANVSGYTYNNGVSGVGATLTQNSAAVVVIDGYTLLLNDRVLFKNQSTAANNGVYFVSTLGTGIIPAVFTRALDYNMPSDINNTGAIPVVNGTVNALTSWLLTSNVITVGSDSLTYTQFSYNPSTILTTANAVTVAQGGTGLGTLTANNVILGNGTSTPSFVAPGTSGNVLTSNGTTWTSAAASGSGGWVLLSTATATNSSALDFTSLINSTYDHYIFDLCGLTFGPSGGRATLQGSIDGGSNWLDTNSSSSIVLASSSGDSAIISTAGDATTDIDLMRDTNNGTGSPSASASGLVHLYNPSTAAFGKLIMHDVIQYNSASAIRNWGGGAIVTTSAVNAIRFKVIGGTAVFAAGNIKMYGVRKT